MVRFQESARRSAEPTEPGNALTFHKLGDHRVPGNRCVSIAHPYRCSSGNLVQDSVAWLRFEKGFGDWPRKIATDKDNLNRLAITIDYGTKDEYAWIPAGCAYLSTLLDSAGVRHQTLSFEGGHGDHVRERIEAYMMPFFSSRLSSQ